MARIQKNLPGRYLAARRQAVGFTQRQVCEKLGISQALLSKMESGRSPIGINHWFELAEILDFAPSIIEDLPLYSSSSQSHLLDLR